MRLSAVLLARVIGLFDVAELNPRGGVYIPDLVPVLVERFRFQNFPSVSTDFDQDKGIVFSEGFYLGQVIDNLTIYNDGIKLDTRSSTEQAKELFKSTLAWLAADHNLAYAEDTVQRWAYVSNLVFQSKLDLDRLNGGLAELSEELSQLLGEETERKSFHISGVTLDIERTRSNPPITPFTIQRRGKSLFSKNKFFSAAPLQTAAHIALLERFEKNFK